MALYPMGLGVRTTQGRRDQRPLSFGKVMATIEAIITLVQKGRSGLQVPPKQTGRTGDERQSVAFTLQLAIMDDDSRTLRRYLNELSGLATMQLLAMTVRPEAGKVCAGQLDPALHQ